MTVIVEQDQSLVETFQGALGGGSTVVGTLAQLEDHLMRHPNEFAVVLGVSVGSDAATGFAERSRVQRPALGVILVRARIDSTVLAGALRAGMREVVEARDLTGLAESVRRAHTVWQAMSQTAGHPEAAPAENGVLVTVFATKGGVGKSVVATNLAAAMADQRKRTCIVDLDIQNGDVAIMLQVSPTRSLADISAFAGVLDQGAVESMLTPHSERLSVVAAPIQLEGQENVSAESIGAMLHLLRSMFDVVVVDTSGSFDDPALQAIDQTDVLVLVGTLDIPALKGLKVATDTLDLLNLPREQWRLVLNRADARVGLSAKEFEKALGVDASVTIPSSRELLMAVNRGEPVVRAYPKDSVSKSLTGFARTFTTATAVPAGDGADLPESPTSGRRKGWRQTGVLT